MNIRTYLWHLLVSRGQIWNTCNKCFTELILPRVEVWSFLIKMFIRSEDHIRSNKSTFGTVKDGCTNRRCLNNVRLGNSDCIELVLLCHAVKRLLVRKEVGKES